MKKLLFLFICIALISCQSPIEKIKNDGEDYVKSMLKDADSYQPINISVCDTFMYCIPINYIFRAKNSFGAYGLEEMRIYYSFRTKSFNLIPDLGPDLDLLPIQNEYNSILDSLNTELDKILNQLQ